jgi:hypothetical protein
VAGSAGLVYYIMKARMEVRLARQREELAAMRAALDVHMEHIEGTVRGAEQVARSKAVEELLADLRVEERHYTREHKALFVTRRSIVRQERIYFRNIPLSNWVEQEMPVEEGADIDKLAKTMAIFNAGLLLTDGDPPERPSLERRPRRLLR